MKTGANGFNDTGSAFKVILKIILQAAMAHSDLTLYMSNRKVTHASLWEGLTTISRYMRGADLAVDMSLKCYGTQQLNFQAYFGRSSGCWSRVTKAVPTWRFHLICGAQPHLHSTLKWSCLVKDWCSRLQRFSKEFFSTISCRRVENSSALRWLGCH